MGKRELFFFKNVDFYLKKKKGLLCYPTEIKISLTQYTHSPAKQI